MAVFVGGSAFGMVQQIAEGYLLVSERTFRRYRRPDLDQLSFELQKRLRGIRCEPASQDDNDALRQRNRRLQRLTSAGSMLRSYRLRFKA